MINLLIKETTIGLSPVGGLLEKLREQQGTKGDWTLSALDKPVAFERAFHELTPLSPESREVLRESGYGGEVIDNIGSEEEATIYQEAGLRCAEVNGKEALVNDDIDLEQKDVFGKTNLERMDAGKPPLDKNGKPLELHHIGQKADSPLAELTHVQHMEGGNNKVLHDTTKESEIDRSAFAKEREAHWKARAETYKQQETEAA